MNQNAEQIARDNIDRLLNESGWQIQDKDNINLSSCMGVAVKEYRADTGIADYVLFVEGKPVGTIEAKREEEGHRLTFHETQTEKYAASKLRHLNNDLFLLLMKVQVK
ncbi:MAG: type I restriction endonuclease [Bacteroidota bacterium]|nr:type I restriction endonuclease [Bacteroidota bacterium]